MAASMKYDQSSPGSPDRLFYSGSQCESFSTASMQRSGSFREGSENPIVARPSSAVMMGEVLNFIQQFDVKLVSGDNRCQQLVSSVFGAVADDPTSGSVRGKLPSSWEELKRAKISVREGSMRARERLKIFHDAVSSFNRYLPNVHSRKRPRSEVLSTEKSGSSSSCDRSLPGSNAGKRVAQGPAVSNAFEDGQQKFEERTKKAVPNKRTRTSLIDVQMEARNVSLAKPLESMERTRVTSKLAASCSVPGDILPSATASIDGWEKARMKKKRSVIKSNTSVSSVSTIRKDGCQETTQALQHRLVSDGDRSRLQRSQGFRPRVADGTAKGDTSLQYSNNISPSAPKADQDNTLLDRIDSNFSTYKERMKLKGINNSASPVRGPKLNATASAPRSVAASVSKINHMVNRVVTPNVWELSNCSNKLPVPSRMDGKLASSATSSSPPAYWAGQRSQKNCRPATKPSFLTSSPTNNELAPSESMSDVATGIEKGFGFAKRGLSASPKYFRLKGDTLSSTPLSESEDSANAFVNKKIESQDDKPVHHVQKPSSLVPPGRESKLANEEETRDTIRKQGRTSRNHMSAGSPMPISINKLAGARTAKQLRTANLGPDEPGSKAGQPLSRKLSDRKAFTRQKHSALKSADLLVDAEDFNEELRAAASAVINPSHALSSSFWKQIETYFRSISGNDIAFLRQQENQGSFLMSPSADDVDYGTLTNGYKNDETMRLINRVNYADAGNDHLTSPMRVKNEITLCQRLLAALIPEEEAEFYESDSEDLIYNTGVGLGEEFGSNTLNQHFLESFQYNEWGTINGQRKSSSTRALDRPGYYMAHSPETLISDNFFLSYDHLENGILEHNKIVASLEDADLTIMPLDGKILLEIENAKLFPKGLLDISPPGDDEILADINYLVDKYHQQVVKKDKSVNNLLKLSTKAKEIYKRDFEASALDQLVSMAYTKYVGSKSLKSSATSKAIKQAALAFVKRTLEQCHMFEDTGKSCFNDPSFLDKCVSASYLNEPHSAATEGESARPNDIILNGALEASIGSQKSPALPSWSEKNLDIVDIYSPNIPRLSNVPSELTTSKEDALSNNRVKKRELSLDEVGRSGTGNTLSGSTKGKRSERDRDGVLRQGTAKTGRSPGERKSKAKPKQRITQLSASINGLLGKTPESPRVSASQTGATTSNVKASEKDIFAFDGLDEAEPIIDLSGLQLPGMDVLGVSDDIDGQGQDFDSWLNIEDDGLQDFDIMGLEIPMDDLSELNMMV